MDKTTEALIQVLKRFGDKESLTLVKGLTEQSKVDAQKQYDDTVLNTALMKKQQGRGMTNTEIAAVHAMDKIKVNPPKPIEQPPSVKVGDTKTNMLAGKDSLYSTAFISSTVPFNNQLHYNDGVRTIDIDGSGIVMSSTGAATLTITPSLITHNMSLVEIDVCSGGVAKKMLILASAPY
jgi:hypothetical protein